MEFAKLSDDEVMNILIQMPINIVMDMRIYSLTSEKYFWCERLINDFNIGVENKCEEEYV